MEDYTKDDVLKAIMPLVYKTRKRVTVDQRSYLIGILAYRFMMTEHGIANTIGVKRDVINYNKRLVIQLYSDKSYLANIYVFAQMFPFDFSIIETASKSNRLKTVELVLDQKFFNKLKATGSILGHDDIRITIKFLLEKSMKIWEE